MEVTGKRKDRKYIFVRYKLVTVKELKELRSPNGMHLEKKKMHYNTTTGRSAGKESTCNAGDPGSIPGSGRSSGEGTGCPLQYFEASVLVQLVKKKQLQCRRHRFDPCVGKIPWRRE